MKNILNEIYIFGISDNKEKKLTCLATIDEFINVRWTENYFEADTFSVKFHFRTIMDKKNIEYFKYENIYNTLDSMYIDGKYSPRFIMTDFSKRVGVIEKYKINETDNEIEIDGRGFLTLFDVREGRNEKYIPSEDTDDHVGIVACKIINSSMDEDPILKSIFVADKDKNKIGEEILLETEDSKTVYETVIEALSVRNVGFNTLYDLNDNKIYFNVIDSSKRKIEVAVSRDDENLISNEYEFDVGNYKNYCLVRGENSISEEVDRSHGGIQYRTVIDSKKKQGDSQESIYRNILRTEGEIELDKHTVEEHFDIEIIDSLSVDIGDTCVVKLFVGYKEIAKEILITSIEHDFNKREYNRKVGFGKPYNARHELQKVLGV